MTVYESLMQQAQIAYESDDEWRDEQDRSDWWEWKAYELARTLDKILELIGGAKSGAPAAAAMANQYNAEGVPGRDER